MKLINANEIYKMPVIEENSTYLYSFIDMHLRGFVSLDEVEQDRVVLKTHLYHQYDHRRYISIQSVWFDGLPCMIIMDAGREGRDENRTIVTDKGRVLDMMYYLRTLEVLEVPECIELDEYTHSPLLTTFGNAILRESDS